MYYKVLITLLILDHILPLPLDKYNIIIITIPKSSHLRNNIKIPIKKSRHYTDSAEDRIEIEHYEEPTEMTNIDDFDYMSDKNDALRARKGSKGYSLDSKDVIKYLIARSDSGSKDRYKHNTGSDEAAAEKAEENPSYDFDSIYGENKIVGGEETEINLYPYHVGYGSNCGAAIIDQKWALTAGHCGVKPYIRVGSKYVNQGQKIMVKHNYIHPEWASRSKDHPFDFDFQILELAEPLKLGDNVQPVKVAHIEDMEIGKVVTVTGWGNIKENGPYSNVLRAVRVPIISKENCQHVPFPYFRGGLTSRMFCAGFSAGMKDACQGDSGGPAMANDRLLGMVSFGYGCATPGSYGVYSKVAKVRPWIEEVTGLKLD